jgi:chorismate mutase/prephenate dehydratase
MSLDELRKRIDELDAKIVQLINERASIVHEIGRLKASGNQGVYSPVREQAVYENVTKANKGPLSDEAIRAIYREVMSGCIRLEKSLVIAYLGPAGSFSHWAARSKFGESVDYEPVNSLDEVFEAVERGRAEYGVVPVENSTEGGIRATLARFLDTPLKACAEISREIHHSLMAKCKKDEIRKVYSRGTVFMQTRRWLRENLPAAELVEVSSTSRAAELAAKEPNTAAIGHADLAPACGLEVLHSNIEDLAHNVTRFFVLGREISGPTGNDKTAILCSVKDKVGALHDMLRAFKEYNINLTKIESFPSPYVAWQYYFFIDFLGHPEDDKVKRALAELKEECEVLKILGAFPKG